MIGWRVKQSSDAWATVEAEVARIIAESSEPFTAATVAQIKDFLTCIRGRTPVPPRTSISIFLRPRCQGATGLDIGTWAAEVGRPMMQGQLAGFAGRRGSAPSLRSTS